MQREILKKAGGKPLSSVIPSRLGKLYKTKYSRFGVHQDSIFSNLSLLHCRMNDLLRTAISTLDNKRLGHEIESVDTFKLMN